MIKSIPIPTGSAAMNWKTIIPKNFSTVVKFGTPHQASPAWGPDKGLGIPKGSDLKGQWDLIPKASTGTG